MIQAEVNRAVARATGETVRTIAQLGFSLADPEVADHDPEPSGIENKFLDWDAWAPGVLPWRRSLTTSTQGVSYSGLARVVGCATTGLAHAENRVADCWRWNLGQPCRKTGLRPSSVSPMHGQCRSRTGKTGGSCGAAHVILFLIP